MIRKISIIAMLIVNILTVYGQDIISCDTNVEAGQNLVVNGGFEDGDTGFDIPGYKSRNKGLHANDYSVEGEYWVHDDATDFNQAFGGAPYEGDEFLIIDGKCLSGNIVWEQKINIAKNTRYYFEAFISSVYDVSTANLRFEINDELLPGEIIAPAVVGQWVSFVDSSWFSGEVEGEITIRIRNDQTINCADGNDFALDNISFTAGCFFGSDGEIPSLGEDLSFCGTDGEITLEPNVPSGNSYKYRWSTDETTSTISIQEAGTYAVCMSTNGSCVKSDVITVTENFDVSLGGNKAVCKEVSDILTVEHNGPLVSYAWYKDGSLIPSASTDTYAPNDAGTYTVEVTDAAAACGTESSEMTLSVGTFSLDLSDDQELCKPGNAMLSAGYDGTSYQWFLDDVRLGQFNTETIEVNQPGTYKVVVTGAICPSEEGTINVTSETFSAVNNTFCPEDGSTSITLSINNTTSTDEDSYIWYSDEELTTQVGTGLEFITPENLTETTSYFVKDNSVFQGTVGPATNNNVNGFTNTGNQPGLSVEVLHTITIDSVLVYPYSWNDGTMNVGITFSDASAIFVAQSIVSIPVENWGGLSPNGIYVPFNLEVPKGDYVVTADGTDGGGIFFTRESSNPQWPYKDGDNIIIIDQLDSYDTDQIYGSFYDWHFSSGAVCDPVEVQAVFDPVACGICPDLIESSVSINSATICEDEILIMDVTSKNEGENPVYTYFVNDVEVDVENGVNDLKEGDALKVTLVSSMECLLQDEVSSTSFVHVIDNPESIITPDEIQLSDFEEITLDASSSDVTTSQLWESDDADLVLENPTDNKLTVTPDKYKTEFYFTVNTQEGSKVCSSTSKAVVIVSVDIKVPNAFSPNGDGVNDEFEIDNLSSLDEFEFKVYNKWGNVIFESNSSTAPFWDGYRNGKDMPVGTYYYTFEYSINGKEYSQNDYISLLK